jgi:Rrf2 family iron-sulfur cluster assembly transcriptional regulator
MKMSVRSLYAVMALVDLALQPGGASVALPDIAGRQGISLSYLEQLFMKLRRGGFVTSVRGQKGGYTLALPPQHIHVAAVLEAMGEQPRATRCRRDSQTPQKAGCLPGGVQCLTHWVWIQLEERIHDYLASVSLADICQTPQMSLCPRQREEKRRGP